MEEAYDRVAAFVAHWCGIPKERLTPETTLFGDLGVDGDDGSELLRDFGREFSVDMAGCDLRRHFGPEGLPLWAPLYWLILAFREGTPEQRARLEPITIADLARRAAAGRWHL